MWTGCAARAVRISDFSLFFFGSRLLPGIRAWSPARRATEWRPERAVTVRRRRSLAGIDSRDAVGGKGLTQALPPYAPQPCVGAATRDGRSSCSGSPLSASLPRGIGRPFCRIYVCKAVVSLMPHVSRTAFSYCSFFRWLAASARHPGVVACAAGDRMAARKGRDR